MVPLLRTDEANSTKQPVINDDVFVAVELSGFVIEATEGGYRISSDLSLTVTKKAADPTVIGSQSKRIQAAANDNWANAGRQTCPEKPSLRVLVGDV